MSRLPHVCGLCLLLRFWQLLALAPFRVGGRLGARCQRWVTLMALFRWLLLTSVAPFTLWKSAAMYEATNVRHSTVFKTIALATMTGDVCISLALLGTHLVKRKELATLVNGLTRLHRRRRLSWFSTVFLWLKLLLSLYELFCNIPFLEGAGSRLPWSQLLAFGVQLYVQHVTSVYANGIFGGMLLILECYYQLDGEDTILARLLKKERSWMRLVTRFVKVFQLGIFLLVIGSFINILANMYAFMSYFVSLHGVPLTISNNCLIMAVQLYAVVLAAHLCQVRSASLRKVCLEREYVPDGLLQDQAMAATPFPLVSPTGNVKFHILGLFTVDHSFWLFLVSYAMNFIVVILQFSLENMAHA
ncbi:LOW QUALITY PROTEIN: putative gustatory receptor 89a [Drosophila eugracilis]|uniref:LOW QUALITY PROTEIN: putative gustatory receptor 89a n=1 Tax=Drosophila eugracilis TaxID=29029 RepID=UPI001BDAF623|nr:LOW QUALITY PROTEIN: putative gustatory receptor 89a [Drosophila eugracilis]